MASVSGKTKKLTVEQVQAEKTLAVILGQGRIHFDNLSDAKFQELLQKALDEVDLREIRGFQPLESLLSYHFDALFEEGRGPKNIKLGPNPKLSFGQLDDFNLYTQVVKLVGDSSLNPVYRRYESDEATNDWTVAKTWGKSGYLFRGARTFLALRRPRNHSDADKNLVLVILDFEKVPHEDLHLINRVRVKPVFIKHFRHWFEGNSAFVADRMIGSLEGLHRQTLNDLEYKAQETRKKLVWFEKLRLSTTYRR